MDRLPDPTLLAVCDVLVLKALENLGKWIIRHERCRPKQWRDKPLHEAHTNWRPDSVMIGKALKGAWDIVPTIIDRWSADTPQPGDDERVMNALDLYVHILARTGTPHSLGRLLEHLQDDHNFFSVQRLEKGILWGT